MRSFVLGFLGACLGLAVFGISAMVTADEEIIEYAEDVMNDVVKENCEVRVGSGMITSGFRCRFNRVMTGFDNNYLYCSDVTVRCRLRD